MYQQTLKHWRIAMPVNVILAVVWITTFMGLHLVDPYSYVVIYFSIPAIMVFLEKYCNEKKWYYILSALGLLALIGYYNVHIYLSEYGHNHLVVFGLALSVLAGGCALPYGKMSALYMEKLKGSATMVLAMRSYGVIVGCLIALVIYSFFKNVYTATTWDIHLAINLAIVVLASFILPVYFNQKGIGKVGPLLHSCIAASCPLFTFVLSIFFIVENKSSYYLQAGFIALAVTVLLIFPQIAKYRSNKRNQRRSSAG